MKASNLLTAIRDSYPGSSAFKLSEGGPYYLIDTLADHRDGDVVKAKEYINQVREAHAEEHNLDYRYTRDWLNIGYDLQLSFLGRAIRLAKADEEETTKLQEYKAEDVEENTKCSGCYESDPCLIDNCQYAGEDEDEETEDVDVGYCGCGGNDHYECVNERRVNPIPKGEEVHEEIEIYLAELTETTLSVLSVLYPDGIAVSKLRKLPFVIEEINDLIYMVDE